MPFGYSKYVNDYNQNIFFYYKKWEDAVLFNLYGSKWLKFVGLLVATNFRVSRKINHQCFTQYYIKVNI